MRRQGLGAHAYDDESKVDCDTNSHKLTINIHGYGDRLMLASSRETEDHHHYKVGQVV